ncbi:glyoxalase [Bacterioplanes sanyensis]|uniref:Glyoxalase n=1 Tax=Bacterioplanes sanyensis TaxID=1249553 RepID=A0A222FMA2_9GAMM|nr:VOC family protein [Bacterioplanes sanyensis]ASP40148.1 glyoxalase [Bacterioplanes sanyensis]
MNLNQVTLATNNIEQSKTFYQTLGFTLIVDAPHYVRFACTQGDATFSLLQQDEPVNNDSVVYFECQHLDSWVNELIECGIQFEQLPTDQRYLWREAILKDPSGNKIKLYWAGENRLNPPWKVQHTSS